MVGIAQIRICILDRIKQIYLFECWKVFTVIALPVSTFLLMARPTVCPVRTNSGQVPALRVGRRPTPPQRRSEDIRNNKVLHFSGSYGTRKQSKVDENPKQSIMVY